MSGYKDLDSSGIGGGGGGDFPEEGELVSDEGKLVGDGARAREGSVGEVVGEVEGEAEAEAQAEDEEEDDEDDEDEEEEEGEDVEDAVGGEGEDAGEEEGSVSSLSLGLRPCLSVWKVRGIGMEPVASLHPEDVTTSNSFVPKV